MRNVFFDTCVYHQAGVGLLTEVTDLDNVLFASEMLGALPHLKNPETGEFWDDTKKYVDGLNLSDDDARRVFELNVRRVYPRLDDQLTVRGL